MSEKQLREFEEQLAHSDTRIVKELLEEPKWASIRAFYENHYDEICDLLKFCKLREVLEDICSLDPSMNSELCENSLFVYQINLAIKNGVLTKDILMS